LCSTSWATSWVAHWGHALDPDIQTIQAEELPMLGVEADQAFRSSLEFEDIWRRELAQSGLARASLVRALMQFVRRQDILGLLLLFALNSALQNVVTIFLIDTALGYVHWLHHNRNSISEVQDSGATPALWVMVAFSGAPLVSVLMGTATTHQLRRVSQRLVGALQVAVYRKVQRLPACSPDPSCGQGWQQADPVQLLNHDIHQNIRELTKTSCTCIVSILTICCLLAIMFARLSMAACVALFTALPLIGVVMTCASYSHTCLVLLQEKEDRRLAVLKEFLTCIRTVKCYAWEGAVECRVRALREQEIFTLGRFGVVIGALIGTLVQLPSLLTLGALAGYCLLNGTAGTEVVFFCLQILAALRNNVHAFGTSSAQMSQPGPHYTGSKPSSRGLKLCGCRASRLHLGCSLGRRPVIIRDGC
jgi:ABC-type multidrug transport system fused ATPase/permease subunit